MSKTLAEAFEAFWAVYPRRPDNPKAPARLVFERRVREGADAQTIVVAAGRYAAAVSLRKLDGPFIPHARTWLSQRRYEDYVEDAPAPAPMIEPAPEHPLAWLKAEIGQAAWTSWISPLSLTTDDIEVGPGRLDRQFTITARTQFALDHVKREWGYLFRARYGADLAWAVQPKD